MSWVFLKQNKNKTKKQTKLSKQINRTPVNTKIAINKIAWTRYK